MSAFLFQGIECVLIAGFSGIIVKTSEQEYGDAYRTANIVLQLTDNDEVIAEYPSIGAASKAVGISDWCIRAVLKGMYKHAGGYKWKRKL